MKKKVMAVAVMTTTLLAGFGTMAAQAHRVPACWLSENAAEHNPHCQRGHDTDPPGGGEHGDCDTISIDLGIEIDICLLVEVDADDLLEVLGLLDGFSVHDKLEWLHGHMSLGDKIDWLLEVIDLDFVWDHFGWFEPGDVFGLLHFIGGGVHDHALGLLDLDLVDGIFDGDGNGGGGGGGDDCSGLVNVCGNANNLNVEDVLDVCTVNADNGFGNGPGDDGNADCDVVDLGEGLLGLGDMDSDWVGFLF
jgi:hypothetical protein